MTEYVVDASIFIAALVEEVGTPSARDVVMLAREQGAVAPPHLSMEVLNALLMKQRRGLIDSAYRQAATDRFLAFVQTSDTPRDRDSALKRVVSLAEHYGLTVYDAAYLELALRQNAILGSFDEDLRRAAKAEGVVVAPS